MPTLPELLSAAAADALSGRTPRPSDDMLLHTIAAMQAAHDQMLTTLRVLVAFPANPRNRDMSHSAAIDQMEKLAADAVVAVTSIQQRLVADARAATPGV